MKVIIIIGLCILLLLSGCNTAPKDVYLSEPIGTYKECNYIKVHFFEEDMGRAVFTYEGSLFLGIVEDVNKPFIVPYQVEIIVCEGRNSTSGQCQDFVYRFALNGEGE